MVYIGIRNTFIKSYNSTNIYYIMTPCITVMIGKREKKWLASDSMKHVEGNCLQTLLLRLLRCQSIEANQI